KIRHGVKAVVTARLIENWSDGETIPVATLPITKLTNPRRKEKSNAIRYSRKRKLRQHRALLRRPWLGPTGCSDPWIPVEWRFLGEASPCSPRGALQRHYQ